MAGDEPRRSGRATKGQHTKNQEESAESETPKPKGKGKGKGSKKAKAEEEQNNQAEEDEEGDGEVSCLCGTDDDEGRNFVCCDTCDRWQHNDCMGLPANYKFKDYYCWRCRPEDHPEIVQALKNGEKEADVAARLRSKKGPKKGRQSLKAKEATPNTNAPATRAKEGSVVSTKAETPTTPAPEEKKRKHTGDENGEQQQQPAKRGKSSTPAAQEPSSSARGRRRKPTPAEDSGFPEKISDVQPVQRQKTAEGLKSKFLPLVTSLTSEDKFALTDGATAESLAEKKAIAVEQAMFTNLCTNPTDFAGAYSSQLRTIMSNVAQNMTLFLSILENSVTPNALSTMTSAEMATEEQKKLDQKFKEEGEKQAMMVQEEGPRIRRTHKGDELVEDTGGMASESITSSAPPRRMLSNQDDEDMTPVDNRPTRPPPIVTTGESSPERHRRSSSNFNIQNVWSSVQSPTAEQRSASASARPTSNHGPPQSRPDADIDRLLDDEGVESAPYSPAEANLDPQLVWRGQVDMPVLSHSIAQFPARAYHVAGSDLGGKERQADIFPKDLILAGRIAADKADLYLNSLSAARYTDVSTFEIMPATSDEPRTDEFNKLFTYLKQRQRYGVVGASSHRDNVKDMYIIPLSPGADDTPHFLARLDYNIVEAPRPRQMLLLVFVLRYKDPATTSTTAGAASASLPTGASPVTTAAPALTPARAGPAMSPTSAAADDHRIATPQFPPPVFPANPYAPPQGTSAVQVQNRELAAQVLGPLADAPVAQSILGTATTQLSAGHLQSLRTIFEQHPSARSDMQEVQRILGGQSSAR